MPDTGAPFENCAWFMLGMTAKGRTAARCLHIVGWVSNLGGLARLGKLPSYIS